MDLQQALKIIHHSTPEKSELKIRHIYDFDLKDEDLDAIIEALKQPNHIKKIFLECNLSSIGIHKMAKFLEDNQQIESFECWNHPHGIINDNLEHFAPVIQKNKNLTRLALSGIGVESGNTASFFQALKNNTHLEYLSLYSNWCKKVETAQQIADMLSNNTALKALGLGGHTFDQKALQLIANSLAANKTLEELDISSSYYVKDEGALLFANQLANDIHLKSLKFFDSNITSIGAKAIATSLLTNTHLSKLDLGCNSIGTEGTLALANALETNRSLQDLSIGVYSANNEGVKAFADMLEKNTALMKFDYNSFYTSGDGLDKLRLDMGLTRNEITFLKNSAKPETTEKQLQDAMEKLKDLQTQYNKQIPPANFSDYVQFRIQGMRSGQKGCCGFPFWSTTTTSSNTETNDESSENEFTSGLMR